MQINPARNLRPLLIVAGIGAVTEWLFTHRDPTPDDQLVQMVDRLTAVQAGSTVIASAIISASAILAAAAIPLVTVWAVCRHDDTHRATECRQPEKTTPSVTTLPVPVKAAPKLDGALERAQLSAGHIQTKTFGRRSKI